MTTELTTAYSNSGYGDKLKHNMDQHPTTTGATFIQHAYTKCETKISATYSMCNQISLTHSSSATVCK